MLGQAPLIMQRLRRYGITDLRRCVLLVGAGLSSTGVLLNGGGLPNWHQLCQLMLEDLQMLGAVTVEECGRFSERLSQDDAESYLDIASLYKSRTDDAEFDRFFAEVLDPPGLRPTTLHEQILSVGFRAILTTNYDRVFEIACPALPAFAYPSYLGRGDLPQLSDTFILKLHGSVYPPIGLKNSLVLSREDYRKLHDDAQYQNTLRAVLTGNPVLAVGYSCQDPDFLRVMMDLRRDFSVGPFVYVLMRDPEHRIASELRRSNIKVIPYTEHSELSGVLAETCPESSFSAESRASRRDLDANPVPMHKARRGIPRSRVGVVPSGSPAVDLALGIGGWPRGYVVEIFGPAATGKTTLLMEALASAQRMGGTGLLIDADHGTDPVIAERLGVDTDRIYFLRPQCLEDAMETALDLVEKDIVDVVALDSIAALRPRQSEEELVKDIRHHQLVTNSLRKLTQKLSHSRATVLITNHIVEKVGVMFGNPETTPWETYPLRYYASIRVDLRRVGTIKSGDKVLGYRARLTTAKNRFAAPHAMAEFDMYFDTGLCWEADILDLALGKRVIARNGAWLKYRDTALGKGREASRLFLQGNVQVCDLIVRDLVSKGLLIAARTPQSNEQLDGDYREPPPANS